MDGDKASCDVKVTMMRKFEHKGRLNEKEEEEGTTGNENVVAKANSLNPRGLNSPLNICSREELDSNGPNMGIVGGATLPNEQGMGVPGQVDLLKKKAVETHWWKELT